MSNSPIELSLTRRTVRRWRKCGWAIASCRVRTGAHGTRSASSAATAASRLGKATGTIAEIEEERRLLYVAMTRAKDNLHLIVPQRFFAQSKQSNGDLHMYASRTLFIPDDILDNFQGCAWPVAAVRAKGRIPPSDPIDISARLRRMWKG